MCGRFTLRTSSQAVVEAFDLFEQPELVPRYNIAPTQLIATIGFDPQCKRRQLQFRRWGLIPSWADDPSIGHRLLNARAETVADKPSFRAAFKKHRCLIVADGFYEWRKNGKAKQPYFIRLKEEGPFAFAGLAEHWHKGDQTIDSATIITTEANALMQELHDRMPAILAPQDYNAWLDPEFQAKDELLSLLRPYPADEMTCWPVSTLVNSPRNESPECVMPSQGMLFD